jgi:hypothetical protein
MPPAVVGCPNIPRQTAFSPLKTGAQRRFPLSKPLVPGGETLTLEAVLGLAQTLTTPLLEVHMAAKKAKKSKRKPNAAFMKPVMPDAALSAVVGSKAMPRTEITKKLWGYIKKHGLQDKKNRRNINADANLKPVFNGKSTVSMFEMTKLVSRHVK